MDISAKLFTKLADMSSAQEIISNYVRPTVLMLAGLASVVATFFIVWAGIRYMTSSGEPEKLEHAKRVLRDALIGLVLVIAAGTLTAILTHAYGTTPNNTISQTMPQLTTIEVPNQGTGIVDILIKAIIGLFKYIVESAAKPFMSALSFFTKETALMAANTSVFRLWATVVGIADSLFILVIALLGFHVMGASALGIEEIELKHLLPQLCLTFVLMNTSIFIIDMVISLSNVLVNAINAAFNNISIFDVLIKIADISNSMGLVSLLVMVVFMVLSVILLVYYVMRLVTLYLGAVLSPLVIMLWVLPGFKDFALTALKSYLVAIFVLFIHVIILQLAASLFVGSIQDINPTQPNVLMGMIVGIAAMLTLLKTQGMMMQMSYVSAGPRTLKKLGTQFVRGVSYTTSRARSMGSSAG